MLLTDIYYEAGEIEARALRRPSCKTPHDPTPPGAAGRAPRRLIGRALIGLGRIIAAEPSPATAQLRVGR
jgi:hypothetical protein